MGKNRQFPIDKAVLNQLFDLNECCWFIYMFFNGLMRFMIFIKDRVLFIY